MASTTNPLARAKKRAGRVFIETPAFMQDKVAQRFGVRDNDLYKPADEELITRLLKNINYTPSLLGVKVRNKSTAHSILIIPRNIEKKVGRYDFWRKWKDGKHTWYVNNITGEKSWVAPKEKIFEKVYEADGSSKWVSSTGEKKDFVTSVEIFEPNGMTFEEIDKMFDFNIQDIEKKFNKLGIEVIKNTKRLQASSIIDGKERKIDPERLILNAPICFKHTIVRWLKQNQSLEEYYKFIESDDYFSADDKVADIYNEIETFRETEQEVREIPLNKNEPEVIGHEVVRTNRVLFDSIDKKLKELEKEGKAERPFEVLVRDTLDNFVKNKTHPPKEMKILEDRFKQLLERRNELKGENFFELYDRYKKVLPEDKVIKIKTLVMNPYNPTWLVKDEGMTSKIKNTLRQEVAKEQGEVIENEPVAQIKPFGIATAKETLKKGGIVRGKRNQPVPIIAHEGELVVPKKAVPAVIHSSAWKNHIEDIARSKNLTFAQAKQYALGKRTIVKKTKPKKKSYMSDTSESDW